MTRIEVAPDVHLNVQDVGEGHPVVLVPGFGMSLQVWDRQARVLAANGFRVVCLDQRGHGESDKPLHGYEIDQLGRDLAAVLDALQIDQCMLVGWSFGGQVAFNVATTRPELVRRLVLVGSNAVRASRSEAFPFGRTPDAMVQVQIDMEHADRLAARRSTIAAGFAEPPRADLLDWLVRLSLAMPSWVSIACLHSMLESDQVDAMPLAKLPVLQIVGTADPVHSVKGARWLSERLPDARLAEIAGCGHYPMFEAADEFEELLLDLLRGDRGLRAPCAG